MKNRSETATVIPGDITTTAGHGSPRSKDKVALLYEAVALETAGSNWTQAHVAALCNRSVSFIRNSDCPKSYEVGHGPKGKPILVYEPEKVRTWMAGRIRATMRSMRRN